MGRGAAISGLFHFAMILAAIITVHTLTSSQEDNGVPVNIVGLSQYGTNGAGMPTTTTTTSKDRPLTPSAHPNHLSPESTPPLPTVPPPTTHAPPSRLPLATVRPPPPTTTQTPSLVHLPPPRLHPPHQSKSTAEPAKTPLPIKQTVSSAPDSTTHQTHAVKTWVPFSPALMTTLQNLRMQQNQDHAPTHPYATTPAVLQSTAGSPKNPASAGLDASERNAIGQHVQPCFSVDPGALGLAGFNVDLLVTTDASGIVRNAVVAPGDLNKMSDASFAAFAQRAIIAVMSAQCANLPLPAAMLGRSQILLFNFTP